MAGNVSRRRVAVVAGVILLLSALYAGSIWWSKHRSEAQIPEIWLLLPDGVAISNPLVRLWLDAAAETGVPMRAVRASRFLRPAGPVRGPRAIVLPDSVHRRASDALLERIDAFVERGGGLLLVYDAATLRLNGTYAPVRSRLSRLAGIDYALYDELRSAATRTDPIQAAPAVFDQFHLPPGKHLPAVGGGNVLGTYGYAELRYPHYVTRGRYDGDRIISTVATDDVIMGRRRAGNGDVVFVNVPLGYLKSQTDGALLHGVLSWFSSEIVGLPRLLSVPDGVGGLVFNWHIDSNASYPALERLMAEPALASAGPFSMHFTAGPDAFREGDGLGIALDTDPRAKSWVERFKAAGHSIGSHGGWIHNKFGAEVAEGNAAEFKKYLAMNNRSVTSVTRVPVREYSSPQGNHPQWITNWLEANGVRAYYFTGNSGMPPTRTYRHGQRSDRSTWAFPIVAYGTSASFEEARLAGVTDATMRTWLRDLVRFTSRHRTARLFYMHPPGALQYPDALPAMLQEAQASTGRFRWYTMQQLAQFLDRYERTEWRLENIAHSMELLVANNPLGLQGMSWTVPKARYCRPRVRAGKVAIETDGVAWILHARGGTKASIELPHASEAAATKSATRCAARPSP